MWNRKIPLITNPYLVLQCIFIPLGIAIVMGGFLSVVTGSVEMLVLFFMISAGALRADAPYHARACS